MRLTTQPMTNETPSAGTERLQKFLSRAGVASRRAAEELILAGRVSVNGAVVRTLGEKVDPASDAVSVDGRPVTAAENPIYLLLNKPVGFVTTLEDPQGRPTVASFIPSDGPRLFPVGRLDLGTSGLLLLTNDGELAHLLMHPRYHVPKTYRAQVDGVPDAGDLTRLREGVQLDDGTTSPAEAQLERVTNDSAVVVLTLREGRKRQVRRMLSAVGHPVRTLERIGYGPLEIGDLSPGEVRVLSRDEVEALRAAGGDA
jgi:pseudouridine synthase